MADYKDSVPCCHCVNIENPEIEKYFKAKCITDDCVKEDGKKYFKIQWEKTWAREEDLDNCTDLLENYKKNAKPQIEVLSQTDNQVGQRVLFVKVTGPAAENADNNGLTVQGLDSQTLMDKVLMAGPSSCCKQPRNSDGEDVKMITYAQLQKAGFLDDDEEPTDSNNQNVAPVDNLECAKQKMYSRIGNSLENIKFIHYVHNDLESSRARRNYSIRRRQPFQLYKCDVCGSEFVHRTHLKIHQRTHTGEKPYKCDYCTRCFAQKGNLHVHMKIHTGEKDFICEYCQRGFITNAQLFVHMRTHTNPNRKRPYATGRPPKGGEQVDDKQKSGDETPNQIIVQLVQPDNEEQGNSIHTHRENSKSPEIPPEGVQLENISTEVQIEDNLKSIPPQNETPVFNMRQVAERNLHNIVVAGPDVRTSETNLHNVVVPGPNVRVGESNLHNVVVPGPNVRVGESNLHNVVVTGPNVRGETNLHNVLPGSNVRVGESNLHNVVVTGQNVRVGESNLHNVVVTGQNVRGETNLHNVVVPGPNVRVGESNLHNVIVPGPNVRVGESNLHNVVVTGANVRGETNLRNVVVRGPNLRVGESNLHNIVVPGPNARVGESNLHNVVVTGPNVRVGESNLHNVVVTGPNVRVGESNLHNVVVTGPNVRGETNLHNVVPGTNVRGLSENGSEMMHMLVAQQ